MTNKNEFKVYGGRTTGEWIELLEEAKAELAEIENEILSMDKPVRKASQDRSLQQMIFASKALSKRIEKFELQRSHIAKLEEIVKTSEKYDKGHGEIIEFLEEVYEADMKWYKEIKIAHGEKTTRELREAGVSMVEVMISKMSEGEAIKTFKNDIEARYNKLVKQIENKVGAIESFDLTRNENISFDGFVFGTEGSAAISTIVAGGYNIQRAHYRTLVKAAKK